MLLHSFAWILIIIHNITKFGILWQIFHYSDLNKNCVILRFGWIHLSRYVFFTFVFL